MKTSVLGREVQADELADDAVRMQIDENGFAQLMVTLAGLYVNPPTAVLREYTSNAFDSHVKAGVKQPVEVTITEPARILDPLGRDISHTQTLYLSVEDFGVGMDVTDLTNIYSKYGASTKRASNQEIGGFGLGAKSALSIADTFTVRARKNGQEVTATVTKDRSGVGVLTFSPVSATRASNGVKVTIPLNVSHAQAMQHAVGYNKFFIGVPGSALLVNGKPLLNVHDATRYLAVTNAKETAGWIEWHRSFSPEVSEQGNSFWDSLVHFVVGGVVYPASRSMFSKLHLDNSTDWWRKIAERLDGLTNDRQEVYLNLPIGGVDLAPNRENIQLTERSARTVQVAFQTFFQLLPGAAGSRLNKEPDRDAAMLAMAQNWRTLVPPQQAYPRTMSAQHIFDTYYGNPLAGLTWRGVGVPLTTPGPSEGYQFVDAAAGEKISSEHRHGDVPVLVEFINRRVRTKVKRMTRKNANCRLVLITPNFDEATLRTISRDIRTYTEVKWREKSVSAYVFKPGQVPAALARLYPVVSLEEMITTARTHRREKAAGREKAPKRPVTYSALPVNPTDRYHGRDLESVLTTDVRLVEGVYFSAHDSYLVKFGQDVLTQGFAAAKRPSWPHISAEFSDGLQRFLPGQDIFIVPETRSLSALNKVFEPQQNLLWHVYNHAADLHARGLSVTVAAATDLGRLLTPLHKRDRDEWLQKLALLAQHTAEISSERLRTVLSIAGAPKSDDFHFALVAGMLNWERFRAENSGLNAEVLSALGDLNATRLVNWFEVITGITETNAGDIAFVLDAFAQRHGWH